MPNQQQNFLVLVYPMQYLGYTIFFAYLKFNLTWAACCDLLNSQPCLDYASGVGFGCVALRASTLGSGSASTSSISLTSRPQFFHLHSGDDYQGPCFT